MGINAVTGVGHENKTEQLKKMKKQNPIQETYGQVSAAINMFKQNPAMIGNLLNGTAQASTQQ